MGFYSRRDIEQALDGGAIKIYSPRGIKISEASVDIGFGDIYYNSDFEKMVEAHPSKEESFWEYRDRHCKPLKFEMGYEMLPSRHVHIAESEEFVEIPNGIQREVTARSSSARMFLRVDSDVDFHRGHSWECYIGRIPIFLNTLGPGIKLYKEERYAQLFLHDLESYLMGKDLGNVLKRGEIKVVKDGKCLNPWNFVAYDKECTSDIILTLDENIKLLKSKKFFDPRESSSDHFEDFHLRHGLTVDLAAGTLFLASTAEKVSLSENYMGMLEEIYRPGPFGDRLTVHPNAPFHLPSSNWNLVLECHADTDIELKAGMPIAKMKIWRMNSPAEYCGRYTDQNGVVESRAHLGL